MAGASVRVEFDPGWFEQLRASESSWLGAEMGPAILADAQAATPVLTGRLRASEDYQVVTVDGAPELQVGSFPDDDGPVEYAAAVEMGFHGREWVRSYVNHNFMGRGEAVLIRAHWRHGNTPEQPYLRPALYRVRTP